jgi:hypothetical protein
MPYRIDEFDDLALPEFLERGDIQNMGAGVAASDFVQMPGGGFYDNYGDDDSPRELAAITKQTVVYDTGGDSVRVQIEALRAKLSKRGRLEALWHDGVVRWLWARLVRVEHPRPFNARRLHLPVNLTFAPATGIWYAATETEDETLFAATSMAETVVVSNAGNVNVVDAVIEYVAPTTAAITLTLENYETSQLMSIAVLSLGAGETVIVNVGNRTVRIHKLPVDIDTISRSGNTITVNTTSAHGLSADDTVVIRGTSYDGYYTVDDAPDTDTVTIVADSTTKHPHGPESPLAGLLAETVDLFANVEFSDPADWLWLVPGDNDLRLTSTVDLDGGTFRVIFNAPYA